MPILNMPNVEELMECLEKFVLEEDKIVTYKWLSIKLKIHVNTSKQLLYSFTVSHDKTKLGICYLLAGKMHDGSYQVVVCRKKDVPKMKESFKDLTSHHVYSIQKNDIPDADLNVILSSPIKRIEECKEDFKRLTSIEFPESVLRDDTDIQQLKMKALLSNKETSSATSKPIVSEDKKQTKNEKENLPGNNSIKESKNESVNSKKGGLAAMFAAQKEVVKTEVKKPSPQKKNNQKGGLSMFLNSEKKNEPANTVAKNSKIEEAKESSPKKAKISESSEPKVTTNGSSQKTKESINFDDAKTESKTKSKTVQNKRKRKSKADEKEKKKRKRIVTVSDSESSDEEQEEEEEEERMDYSPLREPTPPPPLSDDETPSTSIAGKKGKKKKLVEKTFMDKDGFLVTKKEYTLVTDSEDEEEDKKPGSSKEDSSKSINEEVQSDAKKTQDLQKNSSLKKETKPPSTNAKSKNSPKSNKASPQKNKQASITSFFTKK